MTFRSLSLKNIRVNWRSYSAFFLSSVFSIAIFYIYYAFMVHPDVVNGSIFAAGMVMKGMEFCLYLISIFSVIFILYSSSSFLKSRKKEFGLFSLFGMTRRQLRRLVFIENMFIGVLAIATGIGVGILFSKFFLMGLGTLLELPEHMRFALPLKAVIVTIVLFLVMFLVISIYTTMRIAKGEIIDLLKAHKQPKGELNYSAWKVVVGTICLMAGYGLAATMTMETFLISALPIIGLVVLGTFLLYSQLSIVILNTLKRRKNLYYNKSNMLIISQLGYKIKDNARILFTITILSAVVMTAMGTIYVLQMMGKQEIKQIPYALAWVESNDADKVQLDRQKLDQLVAEYGMKISREDQLQGLKIENYKISLQANEYNYSSDSNSIMLVSLSAYQKLNEKQTLKLNDKEAFVLLSMSNSKTPKESMNGVLTGAVGDQQLELSVIGTSTEKIINSFYEWNNMTVVVSDQQYEKLSAQVDPSIIFTVHGIEFNNMKKSAEMLEEYANQFNNIPTTELIKYVDYDRDITYLEFLQFTSLTLFIGFFICFLFFIAAGSLIYFKLFTERDEDIAMFQGLKRIGITFKEMRKVVVTQIGIIFFLPCFVGILHAMFAMIALENLMMSPGWFYSLLIFAIYIAMQGIYFIIASRSYLHSIRKGAFAVS